MNKKTEKLLEDQYDSIEAFNSSKKFTPSFVVSIRFIKIGLFICFCILILFVCKTILASSTPWSPKYKKTVTGKITQACFTPPPGRYGRRINTRYCSIQLESNKVVVIDIGYRFQPRKGNDVTLVEYAYKNIFGITYKYEFRRMGN